MSVFVLKLIAAFFMVVDHAKDAFPFFVNNFSKYFGRIAFPLFAFCAVQGYVHTRDFKKYIKRLIIAGIITEVPYLIFNSIPTLNVVNLNIMFTLAMGLIAIKAYDACGKNFKGFLAVIGVAGIGELVKVDYGIFGVLLIFSFYVFKDSKWKTLLASFTIVAGKYLYRIFILNLGFTEYPVKNWIATTIPIFLVVLYNGKKGPSLKWFFYIFYPLHLLILWLLSPYGANLIRFLNIA